MLKLKGVVFIDGVEYKHDELSKIIQEHKKMRAEIDKFCLTWKLKKDGE